MAALALRGVLATYVRHYFRSPRLGSVVGRPRITGGREGYFLRGLRGAGATVISNTQRLFKILIEDLVASSWVWGILSGASQCKPGFVG